MSEETRSEQPAPMALSKDRAKLLDLLRDDESSSRVSIHPYEREKHADRVRAPTSWAQQRLWFIDQMEGGGPAYNIPLVVKLEGVLDEATLRRALESIVRRHEVLRTVFASVEGEPWQEIRAEGCFPLAVVDLGHCMQAEREEQIRRHQQTEALGGFDLQSGPLARATLLRLGPRRHVLVLTIHHIVADGWSIGILLSELAELYSAYLDGRPDPLEPLPIQYADYAQWQRRSTQSRVANRQLRYWGAHLQDAPADLGLPADRPRPAVKSYRGESISVALDGALIEALNVLARRHRMTLFMVLYGGWALLLSRLAAQLDVVIGTPVANRPRTELEGLVGFFVNTLALRIEVNDELPLEKYLQRVRDVTLSAYDHQDAPFEKVVEALRPQRSANRHPIFQVMFALQNAPRSEWQLPGLNATLEAGPNETAKFDLLLTLEQRSGQIVGAMNFDKDILERATVERWAAYYAVLLRAIAECPDERSIGSLEFLPPAERRRLIELSTGTRTSYPQHRLTHELFEQQVARTPSAPAVAYREWQLTYAELNARSNQLARYLRGRGLRGGDYIPVLMSRSLQMLIAQLAVLKSGGVYVPMDPELPTERLAFMVRDCAAKLIVMDGGPRPDLEITDLQWIDCPAATETIAAELETDLELQFEPVSAAYVMYTSGSMGAPKGVVVPHSAVNRLVINNGYARIEPEDCIIHYSNPAFDASTLEIWGALLSGARMVIVPKQIVLEAGLFADIIKRHRATVMYMSVGLFNQYADIMADVFPQLRYLMVGGDSLEPAVIKRVLQRSPPKHLLNVYGPTECTTFSTTHRIEKVEERATSIPIGRPMANAQAYILDARGQLVPAGVVGELHVGGAGVACGYLNRPQLTAEKFLLDPFSEERDSRMYKTGDLCRWRADGTVEYLGRNDLQVKIRGFRIELGEIETRLAQHGQVKDTVVVARQDEPGEKRLVAYVVARDPLNAPSGKDLRAYLKEILPDYMLPSAFIALEQIPLSSSGKVDRRALPAPPRDAYVRPQYEAPQGDLEQALAEIWQNLLGVERIGHHDDFFELGGHSLLVLKALFKIERRLRTVVTVKDVYSHPTVKQLALRISRGVAEDGLIDLAREAVLDPAIRPIADLSTLSQRAVLLTGATGFVGRFLMARLLEDVDVKLYCLVRASSKQEARTRLRQTIAKWGFELDDHERRIIAVPADMRLPRLGLDQEIHELLCRNVDSIYHCATSMNHLETYAMAKPANVAGIRELLSVATIGRPKQVNYLSTMSVFSQATTGLARSVDERSEIDAEKHATSAGYAASKWVGEKIIMMARDRGIPCNIFRLGLVWADAQLGRYDELQRSYRMIKSCLLSGYGVRDFHYDLPPAPVDFVSQAIVHLARHHPDGGGVFHITSSKQMEEGVFERLNDVAGTSLQLLSYYEWIRAMKHLHDAGQGLPVVPLIEFAFSMTEEQFCAYQQQKRATRLRFDCAETHRELERGDIFAPALDDRLLSLCVADMLSRDAQLRQWLDTGAAKRRCTGNEN